MPRCARVLLLGATLHLMQHGNNRSACFYTEPDHLLYLDVLADLVQKYECAVRALCLMTSHVHLLLILVVPQGAGLLMKPGKADQLRNPVRRINSVGWINPVRRINSVTR